MSYLERKLEYSKGKARLWASLNVCILKCFKVVYIFSLLPHLMYKLSLRSSHLSFLVFLSTSICSFQFLGCCSNPALKVEFQFFSGFFSLLRVVFLISDLKIFLFYNKSVSQSSIIVGVLFSYEVIRLKANGHPF